MGESAKKFGPSLTQISWRVERVVGVATADEETEAEDADADADAGGCGGAGEKSRCEDVRIRLPGTLRPLPLGISSTPSTCKRSVGVCVCAVCVGGCRWVGAVHHGAGGWGGTLVRAIAASIVLVVCLVPKPSVAAPAAMSEVTLHTRSHPLHSHTHAHTQEDDDYMSAAFVAEEGGRGPRGVDPRHDMRSWKRTARVRAEQERLIEEAQKRPKPAEHERAERARGLAQPISAENKGFGMLLKMGFKPGQGLGKDETGRSEPIPIEMKAKGEERGELWEVACSHSTRSLVCQHGRALAWITS